MSPILEALIDPDNLDMEADGAAMLPAPEGPALAFAFRFAARMIRAKKSAEEIAAASAEAQRLADGW
jgi:hypothetical protein